MRIIIERLERGSAFGENMCRASFLPGYQARSKSGLYIIYDVYDIKKRHDLYVVPFLFGMSLRGFPRCIAVLSYIQSWGMLLFTEDVYINWSSLLQERSWGKRSATV